MYDHLSEKYGYDVERFVDAFMRAIMILKENIETEVITKLKYFILQNKDRDDIVGDLCSDLMRDEEFVSLKTEDEQREHLILLGNLHSHIQDSIIQLFEEYSGEEIEFEEEEDEL